MMNLMGDKMREQLASSFVKESLLSDRPTITKLSLPGYFSGPQIVPGEEDMHNQHDHHELDYLKHNPKKAAKV